MEEIYTVSEVASILGTNVHFIYDQIYAGNLKAMRMGHIKIREKHLNQFVENWEKENPVKGEC